MTDLGIAGVHVTDVGLELTEPMDFGRWSELGETLARLGNGSMWWLGDWWNIGENRFGETAAQAISPDDLARPADTVQKAGWVAGRVDLRRRRRELTWSHHREIAPLNPADQDMWLQAAIDNAWSRNELRKQIRARRVKTPPLPVGDYRCIVLDPPWPMDKIVREVRPKQGAALDYPTMPIEQIEAVCGKVVAAQKNAHIYLWTTHRFLPDALRLFEAWGASYECLMTWMKNVGPTPFSWMYDTEHVLFGRRGALPLNRQGLRLSFQAPAVGHSIKPDIFYQRVLEASPGPRLAMFERGSRDGFEVWGDELAA